MKPAPNWQLGQAPDGKWKEELIPWLGKITGIKTLVESGSCEGSMIAACQPHFDEIHSVELAPLYMQATLKRVGHFSNVHLYLGDTRERLPEMIGKTHGRLLFWLDAHHSGIGSHGPTADAGDPLEEELRIIMNLKDDCLIVIDDLQDGDFNYPLDPAATEKWRRLLDGWTRDYRCGILMLHQNKYHIPEFEENND
jgi:hypothetical protein